MPLRPGLRICLLAFSVISLVYGLQHLVFPRALEGLSGARLTEPAVYRVLGAALIGFSVAGWMAFRAGMWSLARPIVYMAICWSLIGAAAVAWGIVFEGLPAMEWLNVTILAAFGILFLLFALQAERKGNRVHD